MEPWTLDARGVLLFFLLGIDTYKVESFLVRFSPIVPREYQGSFENISNWETQNNFASKIKTLSKLDKLKTDWFAAKHPKL